MQSVTGDYQPTVIEQVAVRGGSADVTTDRCPRRPPAPDRGIRPVDPTLVA
jgi:hypothetical protein